MHVINEGMDTGKIVMQSALSSRSSLDDFKALRHRLFLHQCAQLLQVFLWVEHGRISVTGTGARVADADYSGVTLNIPAYDDPICQAIAHGEV